MAMKHIILIFVFLGAIYSFFVEPNILTVKTLKLESSDIKNLKIVFVSDFHLSKHSNKRFERIIEKVNEQNADIIISGGDYLKRHSVENSMELDKITKGISSMKSKYGIYSVLGNHDSFKDGKKVEEALTKFGIVVLENKNTKLEIEGKPLYLAGISDMQTTHYSLDKALQDTNLPIILISHSPDITPNAKGKVNLVLSGHTHGGQIRIPFFGAVIVPSKYGKRYEKGFVDNFVYVTKGLGTSIVPLRFNCLPEITVIEFAP